MFLEQNSRQCEVIKGTLERNGLAMQGTVRRGSALTAVGRLTGEFNLIFADPPYALNEFKELFLNKIDSLTKVYEYWYKFIKKRNESDDKSYLLIKYEELVKNTEENILRILTKNIRNISRCPSKKSLSFVGCPFYVFICD